MLLPLVGTGYKDRGSLHDPPLNVALLLLVDHNEMVGVQLDGRENLHRVQLQPVHKQLTRPERCEV